MALPITIRPVTARCFENIKKLGHGDKIKHRDFWHMRQDKEMMKKQIVRDVDAKGKRGPVPVDFNGSLCNKLRDGKIQLLENPSFNPKGGALSKARSWALARLADLFVNDALGVSHQAYTTMIDASTYVPAVVRFLAAKGMANLQRSERPICLPYIGGKSIVTARLF